MSSKQLPTLDRLLELDEISAVMIYARDGQVLGRAVPHNYNDDILEQVVSRIQNVTKHAAQTKIMIKEARFRFEAYGIWIKAFADDLTLAVFIQPGSNYDLLRQPINLALVNLEKSVDKLYEDTDSRTSNEIAAAAIRAEMELLKVEGEDSNAVLERLGRLTENFVGPAGYEVLEHGLREAQLSMPIETKENMMKLIEFCTHVLSKVEHKKQFMDEAEELVERLERELTKK